MASFYHTKHKTNRSKPSYHRQPSNLVQLAPSSIKHHTMASAAAAATGTGTVAATQATAAPQPPPVSSVAGAATGNLSDGATTAAAQSGSSSTAATSTTSMPQVAAAASSSGHSSTHDSAELPSGGSTQSQPHSNASDGVAGATGAGAAEEPTAADGTNAGKSTAQSGVGSGVAKNDDAIKLFVGQVTRWLCVWL